MGAPEVPTTLWPSRTPASFSNGLTSFLMASGFGLTRHTRSVFIIFGFDCLLTAHQLDTWLTAPYKKPESLEPEKETFNNHLSILRIRSEHAIGFLKGRFHSLKHLRVNIKDEASHKIATYWISACVGIHSFAMDCEEEERGGDGDSDSPDPFIAEGLSSADDDSDVGGRYVDTVRGRNTVGKRFREVLKGKLFRAKEKRRVRRAREQGV